MASGTIIQTSRMSTAGATKGSVRTFCPDLRTVGADLTSPVAMVADIDCFPSVLRHVSRVPRHWRCRGTWTSSGAFGSLLLEVAGLLHGSLGRGLRRLERLIKFHLAGQCCGQGLAVLGAERLELRDSDELDTDIGLGIFRGIHRIGGFARLLDELGEGRGVQILLVVIGGLTRPRRGGNPTVGL